jgi:glycosyltransferase involved in cell wall biosynthesis
MINSKRIVVVMPAYNAEKTLAATVRELPDVVDQIILVDDHSTDQTAALAHRLGLTVAVHEINRGYGANQKTCYSMALAAGADVVVMIHPDYQYSPLLVTPMAGMAAYGVYDLVLGSRILGGQARHGGMPLYKYFANRVLTFFQNFLLGAKLSEYHTGFRAYTRQLLLALPLEHNSDNFVFDNQVIAEALLMRANFPEASSINLRNSLVYGWGVVGTTLRALLAKWGLLRSPLFDPARRLGSTSAAGANSGTRG